jgi:NarL family two-component system response regulator LiaR
MVKLTPEDIKLTEKTPIRVLIVDDHPTFAQGLSRLLEEQPDLEPIGIAADGEEAVSLTHELKPDVVVMDISMPKLNGIKATRKIKQDLPNTIVLVLSAYGYHPYVLSVLEAGAAGYLLKSVPMRELMNAIRALCAGETVLDQEIAGKLLRSLAKPLGNIQVSGWLSSMELQVLELGARGLSNKEIGDKLSVSERTVQSHFTTIFQKLGVGSRIEAVLRALKEGWLTMEDIP